MRGVAVGAMKEPGATVAEDVNWTARPGEFWVIAGPQRSGKSDFLMMTGGLMAPVRGTYHFFGQAMPIFEDARLAERLRLGLVFDGGQLFNQMTLAENIALPLRYHEDLAPDAAGSRVRAMLDLMELGPWAGSAPANVARNWQKRAGLARALVLRPDVLLLDNPLAGLDARHAYWWLNFLGQLARGHSLSHGKPMAIVATSDDLRAWRGHAQRVACLTAKRLLVLGDWAEVDRCAEDAVRDLLRAAPTGH
jgi:ABC-type transporter Mla maintaining outer membrane lipid asymmetry ATPase subunit MlaF